MHRYLSSKFDYMGDLIFTESIKILRWSIATPVCNVVVEVYW